MFTPQRLSISALCASVVLFLAGTASGATILDDGFNTDAAWKTLSDTSLEPSAIQAVDPAATTAASNLVLRFMRENDARVARDISPLSAGAVIKIEFRILKTGSTNTGGVWLVDASGTGTGFLVELNTPQAINRVKILDTPDAAATRTLVKALANVAPQSSPGQTIWHKVVIVWDTAHGSVEATIDGHPAGETVASPHAGTALSRVILQGGFPSTLYLDDLQITATR